MAFPSTLETNSGVPYIGLSLFAGFRRVMLLRPLRQRILLHPVSQGIWDSM